MSCIFLWQTTERRKFMDQDIRDIVQEYTTHHGER